MALKFKHDLRPRDIAVLKALASGDQELGMHAGRVWRVVFPNESYRGRRDAGMTRTLDRLERMGLVRYRYTTGARQPSRVWMITSAGLSEIRTTSIERALQIAITALERISDPDHSSMRMRDPNCVRYIASDILDILDKKGYQTHGVRWVRFDTVGGNIAGEATAR